MSVQPPRGNQHKMIKDVKSIPVVVGNVQGSPVQVTLGSGRYLIEQRLPDGAIRMSVRQLTGEQYRRLAARREYNVEPTQLSVSPPVIMGRQTDPIESWYAPQWWVNRRPARPPSDWKSQYKPTHNSSRRVVD